MRAMRAALCCSVLGWLGAGESLAVTTQVRWTHLVPEPAGEYSLPSVQMLSPRNGQVLAALGG